MDPDPLNLPINVLQKRMALREAIEVPHHRLARIVLTPSLTRVSAPGFAKVAGRAQGETALCSPALLVPRNSLLGRVI